MKKALTILFAVALIAAFAVPAMACYPCGPVQYLGKYVYYVHTSYDYGNETASATQDDYVYGYRYKGGIYNFNGGEAMAQGNVTASITAHNPYAAADATASAFNFGLNWKTPGQEAHSMAFTVAKSRITGTVGGDINTTTYESGYHQWRQRFCHWYSSHYHYWGSPYSTVSYDTLAATGTVTGHVEGFARQFNGAGIKRDGGNTYAYGWNDTQAGYSNDFAARTNYQESFSGFAIAGGRTDVYVDSAGGPNWMTASAEGETRGGSFAVTPGGYNPSTTATGQGSLTLNAFAARTTQNGTVMANSFGTASFSYNNSGGNMAAGSGYASGNTNSSVRIGANSFCVKASSHMEAGANSFNSGSPQAD